MVSTGGDATAARSDMGAAREHGILDALAQAGVRGWPTTATTEPARQRRFHSAAAVWTATPAVTGGCHATRPASTSPTPNQRGPGERANAQLKNSKNRRNIRSCPLPATTLVNAVWALILAG
jgi:hypothetical protein